MNFQLRLCSNNGTYHKLFYFPNKNRMEPKTEFSSEYLESNNRVKERYNSYFSKTGDKAKEKGWPDSFNREKINEK